VRCCSARRCSTPRRRQLSSLCSNTKESPWVDPAGVPAATGDRTDDHLVALHRSSQADLLASRDSDLLGLAAQDFIVLTTGALPELLEHLQP